MEIRPATIADVEDIKTVHLQAFDESERQQVADLAAKLQSENCSDEVLSLVAVDNNEVVGHIAFSRAYLEDSQQLFAYLLGPLGVLPSYQKQGVGSALIKQGLVSVSKESVAVVFVYGDPAYYSRFGFNAELAKQFLPPYKLQYPHGWLAMALNADGLPEGGKIRCVEALNNADLW